FSFTLIYPQPCSAIHPPVATDHFEHIPNWWRGASRTRVLLEQNKILQNHFFQLQFSSAEKFKKQAFC
ncbi:MAG: hypothetical protein IJY46_07400, partial [Lentisphaeria bacterium]|nr:hypothetical protein [Lentisphaeria bacterium]